jgi:CheY-like chemotaxis protein
MIHREGKDGRTFEILLVEGGSGDADRIRAAIDSGSHPSHVTSARDGSAALGLLRDLSRRLPDLVLLDIDPPQADGYRRLLQAMKADVRLAGVPVVVLSAAGADADVAACYGLRAGGYVIKPDGADALARALHRVEDYWFSTVLRPGRV